MDKIYHTIAVKQPFADNILHGDQTALMAANYKEIDRLLICTKTTKINDGHLLCLADVESVIKAPDMTDEMRERTGYNGRKKLWGYCYLLSKIKPVIEFPIEAESFITEKIVRDVQEYPAISEQEAMDVIHKYNLLPKRTKTYIYLYIASAVILIITILALFFG